MPNKVYHVHNTDPWLIIRTEPNAEDRAARSMHRAGFEAWYPSAAHISLVHIPLRKVTANKRNKRPKPEIVEKQLPALRGYVFARLGLGNSYDLGKVHELNGVLGLCCFGEDLAYIKDHEIELLRVREARGDFNTYDAMSGRYQYLLDQHIAKVYSGGAGKAIDNQHSLSYIDTLDRLNCVARPVTQMAAHTRKVKSK